ncbi:uncharacterized protein LOC143522989 isoform X2 [Brachyhypopomus gauderio]|uniref:uncharacterized protein LOC143522989 isoform X2 n=1 Tax=Brachyhypopomus gauderio TaxID=698409 RepID=UPI00404378A8
MTSYHNSGELWSVCIKSEEMDFKTLKSRFQNDDTLKIRTKPFIPDKPQTVTSPTSKVSNPLVASMNSAMESRTRFTPRVVFKDKSPVKRQPSLSEMFPVNGKNPQVQSELLDKNQKKEGDLIKQALKDRKLPLVLPAGPVTPATEDAPTPRVSASPAKVSSPKKYTFNFKTPLQTEKEKPNTSEHAVSANTALDGLVSSSPPPAFLVPTLPLSSAVEPDSPASSIPPPAGFESGTPGQKNRTFPLVLPMSPVTPSTGDTPRPQPTFSSSVSSSPVKVSTPKYTTFNFKSPLQREEKADSSKSDVPVSSALDDLVHSSPSTIVSKNVSPESCDQNPYLVEPVPSSSISAPSIHAPVFLSPTVPQSDSPILTASERDNFSRTSPELKISNPTVPSVLNSAVPVPKPVVFSPDLTDGEAVYHPDMISDILDMDIPPPIIPEDLLDAVMSVPRISAASSVRPELENGMFESHKVLDQMQTSPKVNCPDSPKSTPALSALARAEEMSHVKHNTCDQRVLRLLEKSKQKNSSRNQSPTPETWTFTETIPHVNESLLREPAQTETTHHETVLPEEDSPAPEATALPHIPLVDQEPDLHPFNSTLSYGLDQRQASPVPTALATHSPAKEKAGPPPPPVRTSLLSGPNLDFTPEKPVRLLGNVQTSTPAAPTMEHNGFVMPTPAGFMLWDSRPDDSKFKDSPETSSVEVPPEKVPETVHGTSSPSVHGKAFWDMFSPEHQISEDFVPVVEATEFEVPRTETDGLPHLEAGSPGSETIPSPSGTQVLNYSSGDHIPETPAAEAKQAKTKKQRKGSPMNPYAEAAVVGEENRKKTLFSRKNSSRDGKELNKKEKQKEKDKVKEKKVQKEKEKDKKELKEKEREKNRDKDKEKEKKGHKEKERDKKELKEKEKEKKEIKEKEKDKKEIKEKEKDKKEIKEKEKDKKEIKEKERDKKEIKEKEREKKEQKEKEKKAKETKKKFKVTGEEEVIHHAKVTEACKGRKDDLAVNVGDVVDVIRTTDCPKGKWLARDSSNKYGYIPVESVELDMHEIMEIGKKAKADRHAKSNGLTYTELTNTESRFPNDTMNQESYDSEEWGDDDESPFIVNDTTDLPNQRAISPERVSPGPYPAETHTDASGNVQARQEALQKLATFFAPKSPALRNSTISEESNPEETVSSCKQDIDLPILPPPELYADHDEAEHN